MYVFAISPLYFQGPAGSLLGVAYWGIIAKTAIWPILQTIDYLKFMLLHNMLNSEDTKVSKKVLLLQARNQYPNCWYSEILQAADEYQLDVSTIRLQNIRK